MKQQNITKAIAGTALLTAIAVILRSISIMVPVAGAPAMRIALDGVFYKMAGFIFGPFFGGVSAGLADIMAYTLKPAGAYIPLFTITTILNGAFPVVILRLLKKRDSKNIEKCGFTFFTVITIIGFINTLFYNYFPNSSISSAIMSIGKKAAFATYGMLLTGGVGLIIMIITRIAREKTFDKYIYNNYFKLIIATGIPAIIVTTLNTYILKIYVPQLNEVGFLVLLVPRVIESLLMLPVEVYIISILMAAYQKVNKMAMG